MLSIGKLGAGQHAYYLDKVAEDAEDYYSGEGEAAGYWLGDAARELGLEGHVEPDQLVAMLTGVNPATGEPLGLRHVAGRGPVPGFDLTFSAPKSVSLAWAMGGADGVEIAAAQAEAVEAALGYLQRSACLTRRGAGGHEFLPGNGFIAAAYVHRTSRAGDPHLHTHVLIANATKGPDGVWRRLYHPAIYEHAKAAGHIHEAVLRHELTHRLGVEWEQPRNGIADLKGFEPEQLDHFSQRKTAILEAAGPNPTAKQLQLATLATRQGKDSDLSDADLRQVWHERAAEVGLTQEQIRSTFGRAREAEQVLTAISSRGRSPPTPPTSTAATRSRLSPDSCGKAPPAKRSKPWPTPSSPTSRLSPLAPRPRASASPPGGSGSLSRPRSPPPTRWRASKTGPPYTRSSPPEP